MLNSSSFFSHYVIRMENHNQILSCLTKSEHLMHPLQINRYSVMSANLVVY